MHKVKVYSTPNCPYCRMLKEFLTEHGIAFEDKDVSVNREAAREMIEKSGQMGVPVTIIDGNVVMGLNKDRLKAFLGIND
jgi:glutaredoxin-like YruB-family protein